MLKFGVLFSERILRISQSVSNLTELYATISVQFVHRVCESPIAKSGSAASQKMLHLPAFSPISIFSTRVFSDLLYKNSRDHRAIFGIESSPVYIPTPTKYGSQKRSKEKTERSLLQKRRDKERFNFASQSPSRE